MSPATITSPTRPELVVADLSTQITTPRGIVEVLDHVSLTVGHAKTLGIVGESGSGKSMLLRSIMGLLPRAARVTSGTVVFDGVDLRALSADALRATWGRDIAMAFQDASAALNPVQRIGRQLTEGLVVRRGMPRRAADDVALELLRSVGIPDPVRRLRAYPHELSGGMRQRVAIAVALSTSPQLLLADEVTSALDVTVQAQLLRLLVAQRKERNMSMIFVTHDLGVVAQCADDIAVMYAGRVVERLPVAALEGDVRHPYTSALLACRPRVHGPRDALATPIPGSPPSLIDPPQGCRFAPRCARAQEQCRLARPPLTPLASDPAHEVACFFPLEGISRRPENRRPVSEST